MLEMILIQNMIESFQFHVQIVWLSGLDCTILQKNMTNVKPGMDVIIYTCTNLRAVFWS